MFVELFDRILATSRMADDVNRVRELRVILESLFMQLTECTNRSFTNLYGRMTFVFDTMQVPGNVKGQFHALRILSNKVAHGSPVNHNDTLLCFKTLAEGVSFFGGLPVPAELQSFYSAVRKQNFPGLPRREGEAVALMKPVVISVGEMQSYPGSDLKYFEIKGEDEDYKNFTLRLVDSEHNKLSYLQPLLKPYDTLHVINCRKVDGREGVYTSTQATAVIIEPDILIDVTEIAETFQRGGSMPVLALLKKLVPSNFSDKAFQGNMVNALLDAAIRNAKPDFKSAYREAVAENVVQAAAIGKAALLEVYKNIKDHHWNSVVSTAEMYRNLQCSIEPVFLSALYGLQGRLDLLVESPADGNRKEIVELKSGKAPERNTWINHEMQVVGYNLLLKSAFGQTRRGPSSILYSAGSPPPLRNIQPNPSSEPSFLKARNEIIVNYLQLAKGDLSILQKIQIAYLAGAPSFLIEEILRFEQAYFSAAPLCRKYYEHFLVFLIREWLHDKCGMYGNIEREENGNGFAALWLQDQNEKTESSNIIPDLFEPKFDRETSIVTFKMPEGDIFHNFRPNDIALIYRKPANGNPLKQQIIKGRVDSVTKTELVFSLNNRQISDHYFSGDDGRWCVEHDIYDQNAWIATRSLFSVLEPRNTDRFNLLIGGSAPQTNVSERQPLALKGLNENHRDMLKLAANAQDYFLLQGPPGTGKTSTMLPAIILDHLQDGQSGSIVIVAFTNRSVEEISKRLKDEKIEHLRLGSRQSESERELRKLCLDGEIDKARDYIQSHRVFLSTVSTMANRIDSLRQLKPDIDTLIVDESSQLTEPQLLCLLTDIKKFILIGDQNQLPPVVAIHEKFCEVTDQDMIQNGIIDLRQSLFERLFALAEDRDWQHAKGILTTHFRMHETIAGLVNHWYANQLRSGKDEQRATEFVHPPLAYPSDRELLWDKCLNLGRTVFIPSKKESTFKRHDQEANRVVEMLRYIRKTKKDFKPEQVGVVTPWRAQVGLIRNIIGNDPELQRINIDTVERFQGSENEIIIVSMAVCSPRQVYLLTSESIYHHRQFPGGIKVDRKLLVTVSRAIKQVIMLGDPTALRTSNHYNKMIEAMTIADTPH